MKPCYAITPAIFQLAASISGKVRRVDVNRLQQPETSLRRQNNAAYSPVSQTDWPELRNARMIYQDLSQFEATSVSSFCRAHRILMNQLMSDPGTYRIDIVRIQSVGKTTYLAPPPADVPRLLDALFAYLRDEGEHPLIKSCAFHYEAVRIHPFIDGNGRVARLWQTLLLLQEHPVFAFVPVETLIGSTLQAYYRTLSLSDAAGNSTVFIEYLLGVIDAAVSDLLQQQTAASF